MLETVSVLDGIGNIWGLIRSFIGSESLLGFLEGTFLLIVTIMVQRYIFASRRKNRSVKDRRYETTVVGLQLLIILLGLYLASFSAVTAVLTDSYGSEKAPRLALCGVFFLLVGIGSIANLVAQPHRVIYPTPAGHAHAVRDAVNLFGFLAMSIYLSVLIAYYQTG